MTFWKHVSMSRVNISYRCLMDKKELGQQKFSQNIRWKLARQTGNTAEKEKDIITNELIMIEILFKVSSVQYNTVLGCKETNIYVVI